MSVVWLADATAHDRVVFQIGRDDARLIARWAGLGALVTTRDGARWSWEGEPGADPALVEKLHAGALRALLRHLRGEATLHASAVAARGGAVAFVGDSGAGKSTLAFTLSTSYDFELLSDDCLCIDGSVALPSERSSWLDARARAKLALRGGAEKEAATPAKIAGEPAPLRAIVNLVYDDDVSIRPLRGAAAAGVLGKSLIRFAIDDAASNRADLDRLADLAQRVPVLELSRPKDFDELARTCDAVARLARELICDAQ